jgi:hypothetical protein
MRKTWQKVIFGSLLLAIVVSLLLAMGILVTKNVSANKIGNSSMLNASPQEIEKAALEYTSKNVATLNATPQVVLSRSVTSDELSRLDFTSIITSLNPPPLWLIILKGDFDVDKLPGGFTNRQVKATYLALVYDLIAGTPTLVQTSLRGGDFRKALNDPSLPDDNPFTPQASTSDQVPITPTVSSISLLPYGVVAPPVTPPTKN